MNRWEYFLDRAYYDLHAVRKTDDRDFNSREKFYLASEEEARNLCDYLNKIEEMHKRVEMRLLQQLREILR